MASTTTAHSKRTPKTSAPTARSVSSTSFAAILESAIRELDPEGTFVRLDAANKTVRYSPEIVCHELITSWEGSEEPTRAYVVCWLCVRGGYLPSNIELEKRYSVGRPKVGAELDILIKYADGAPYALVEVKAPEEYEVDADKFIKGQLFDIAPHETGCKVLSYVTVNASTPRVRIIATTIDYSSSLSFEDWSSLRAASHEIPGNFGEPIHVHFAKGSARDLTTGLGMNDFKRLRKRLHDVLWKGSTPDNTIYAYVVRLFLAKIYDEKNTSDGDKYQFQIMYSGSAPEKTTKTFERINALYVKAFDRYFNIDGNTSAEPLNARDFSAEQLAFVVQLLQRVSLTHSDARSSDVLGSFFEGITREGFKQSKGLFFTHMNIVYFVLKVLDVEGLVAKAITSSKLHAERLPFVIDPSCGSGSFLLSAMRMITAYVAAHRKSLSKNDDAKDFLNTYFPEANENTWARDFLYGIEQNELLAMSAKVNMVLRRDGNMHIFARDGLSPLATFATTSKLMQPTTAPSASGYRKVVANGFDVVVSNPPFSITLDPDTTRQLTATFELADRAGSETLFLERWYQLLKPGGRLGAVMPESFFGTKENLDARLFLFARFNVRAVVSLPRHAFEPWTPTRTSLLFAQKKTPGEEAAWLARVVPIEVEVKEARGIALGALRRALKARNDRAIIAKQCAVAAKQYKKARVGLTSIDPKLPTDVLEQEIAQHVAMIDSVDPRIAAFREAVRDDRSEIQLHTVENIGYKRTRRNESERNNELFNAVTSKDNKRVQNLHLVSEDWKFVHEDSGNDVLSRLAASDIWR